MPPRKTPDQVARDTAAWQQLGAHLRQLLAARGETPATLATKAGVNRTVISRVANGHRGLSAPLADKVARALGVSTLELMRFGIEAAAPRSAPSGATAVPRPSTPHPTGVSDGGVNDRMTVEAYLAVRSDDVTPRQAKFLREAFHASTEDGQRLFTLKQLDAVLRAWERSFPPG